MTIQPLRDFILVEKPVDKEEKLGGGLLYKPATAESKIVQSKVLSVGTGRVTENGTVIPLEIKVGDTVAFNKSYAVEMNSGSDTVYLIREEHLLAVLR